jgi:hypothetical protein
MFSSFYANDNLVETSTFENLHNLSGAPNGQHRKGTFWADVNDRYYNKKWPSMAVFEHWMAEERARCHIDFVKAYKNAGVNCDQQVYSCSSGITGGDRKYQKKDPEMQRKVPSRKVSFWLCIRIPRSTDGETDRLSYGIEIKDVSQHRDCPRTLRRFSQPRYERAKPQVRWDFV